ncbi:unnamed protein product [Trichobilharzia regenti]|nr:unnamed protein product [Trichobilharzia regenti]
MFFLLSLCTYSLLLLNQVYTSNKRISSIFNNKTRNMNHSNQTSYYTRSYHTLLLENDLDADDDSDVNSGDRSTQYDYSHSNLNFNWKSSTTKMTDWAEKRLIKDLLHDYEKQSRPVVDGLTPEVYLTPTQVAQQITVEFGLELLQILDLDEMDQILTTSVRSLYVS